MPKAFNIVCLTGAGISVESGLPTFTGAGGLWAGRRRNEICSVDALERNPEAVCAFYDERRLEAARAEPNSAHIALADLERHWREKAKGEFILVTQNVDDLHERAGSQRVIHMHGQLNSAFCVECGWQGPRNARLEGNRECPVCEREALRPDIVLFGEAPRNIQQIDKALKNCGLFVSIGTSAKVYPAAGFVDLAKSYGAEALWFNINPLPDNSQFDMNHLGPASETIPRWVDEIFSQTKAVGGLAPDK